MLEDSIGQILSPEISLSKEEADLLAQELTSQLKRGEIPEVSSKQIDLMIAGLGDSRGLTRRTFAESLGMVGEAATPALRKALLHHSNVTVRRAAAKALKLVGDPSALPDLLNALINDTDLVVQGSSAGAMAIFGEKAVDLLMQVLINPTSNAMQCGLATWGLAFVGAEAPNAIRKAAQSDHAPIRAAAIAAIGDQIHSLKDEAARDLLHKALEDPSAEVRIQATKIIGQIDELQVTQDLLKARLSDSSPEVRKSAALYLMRLNAFNSVNELKAAKLIEQDSTVLNVLRLAIKTLSNLQC